MARLTVTKMKEINEAKGGHFFDRETMEFFGSRIEYAPNKAHIFITSERDFTGKKRFYTVRWFDVETGDVLTIPPFNKLTKEEALQLRKAITKQIADMTNEQIREYIHSL
jgi:hypothetical protein